jgi:hypothetical protein
MGSGNWSHDAFRSVSTARSSKKVDDIFVHRALHAALDPAKMTMRESRDSADHPESNAVIVAFDVTGSMGEIPEYFAREALGTLMRELLAKRPVTDPQLLVAAVGDAYSDKYPLQVGQFESDNRMDEWLTKIALEGGGGGQHMESYGLAHWFAGRHTSIDCFEKRATKGFLFTVGDEWPHPKMERGQIANIFGKESAVETDIAFGDALASAQRLYEVFHVVVASRSYKPDQNVPEWRRHLGERVLVLDDYKALAELITTTIALCRGMGVGAATAGFNKTTTDMVLRSGVTALSPIAGATSGIVPV